jgi:hypothetical protein
MTASGRNLTHLHSSYITPGLKVRELRSGQIGTVVRFGLDPHRRAYRGADVRFAAGTIFVLASEMATA